MWSVWLLLHSVFQNRYTNLKIFQTRFPASPYISILPEPSRPSNRMEYPTKCVVAVELYICLLSEIPSYPCFYSHSSCASLLRSKAEVYKEAQKIFYCLPPSPPCDPLAAHACHSFLWSCDLGCHL